MIDLLLTGARVIDPADGLDGLLDVAVDGGRIVDVAPETRDREARRTVDASGKWILPGLVDTHVHVSEPFGGFQGFHMLAEAGVTCALDLAGFSESLLAGLRERGTGITLGFVHPLVPGGTLSGRDPGAPELERVLHGAVESGALGVKLLGGHYPVTPGATARVVRLAHETGIWCAVHAGTTESGSDIEGLEELVELADGLPVHVAHVNSYCRGQKEDPLLESHRALEALRAAPRARSESYLSALNGAIATIEGGVPESEVVRTCLEMSGYPPTAAGMESAIGDGLARVHLAEERRTRLLEPAEGLEHYEARGTRVAVSFPVNPPQSSISLAIARTDGEFTVTALSTDGGAFPRNTTLEQGLALVRFGALSLADFVVKACLNPARMLGLSRKGHLGVGADADIVVVDPACSRAEWVVACGQVVVERGEVVGRGGRMLTTRHGETYLREEGVERLVVSPEWLRGRELPDAKRRGAHVTP